MFQISSDLSTLTHAQKAHVARFILEFPTPKVADENNQEVADTEEDEPVTMAATRVYDESEDGDLGCDHSESQKCESCPLTPEQAFGNITPAPVTATPLDKNGLPWDERIHSSSKATTVDGAWRMKRGVDDALVAQVEGQLKALMGIPAPAPVPVEAFGQLSDNGPLPVPPPPVATIVPPAPVAPPPPPAVPPAQFSEKQGFINLINIARTAVEAKKLTQDEIQAACVAHGVPQLPLLGSRLDLVPPITTYIEALIASRA